MELAGQLQNPTLQLAAKSVQALCIWRRDPEHGTALFDEGIRLSRAGAGGVVLGHSLAIRAVLAAMSGQRWEALNFLRDRWRRARLAGRKACGYRLDGIFR